MQQPLPKKHLIFEKSPVTRTQASRQVILSVAYDNKFRFHFTDEGLSISRNICYQLIKSQWETFSIECYLLTTRFPFLNLVTSSVPFHKNWNTQYNGKRFYSHGTNHSCGVMILIKDDLEFEVKSAVSDSKGRYILIDATVQGSDFLLVNIYAPNKVQEQCEFFSGLEKTIEKLNTSAEQKTVVGGDFNVAIDPDLDCSGGNPTKKDSVKHIQDMFKF